MFHKREWACSYAVQGTDIEAEGLSSSSESAVKLE